MKTAENKNNPTIELLWSSYKNWDKTAGDKGGLQKTWRSRVMMYIIFGALTGVLAGQFGAFDHIEYFKWASKAMAVISTLLVAAASFASSEILTDELDKTQIGSRAAAETLKSDTYLYIFKAEPYDSSSLDIIALDRLEKIRLANAEIPYLVVSNEEALADLPPENMDIEAYIEERVTGQIKWFEKKSGYFQARLKRYKNVMYAFGFVGVILGSAGAFSEYAKFTSVWIAFATSASAAISSYVATNRYQTILLSYQNTALRLKSILARYRRSGKATHLAMCEFVFACEDELARERAEWVQMFNEKLVEKDDLSKLTQPE